MSQPNDPRSESAPQVEAEHLEPKAAPPSRRLPYEKPVLKRMGSVNKLTLSGSVGAFTDGSLRQPKMTG